MQLIRAPCQLASQPPPWGGSQPRRDGHQPPQLHRASPCDGFFITQASGQTVLDAISLQVHQLHKLIENPDWKMERSPLGHICRCVRAGASRGGAPEEGDQGKGLQGRGTRGGGPGLLCSERSGQPGPGMGSVTTAQVCCPYLANPGARSEDPHPGHLPSLGQLVVLRSSAKKSQNRDLDFLVC